MIFSDQDTRFVKVRAQNGVLDLSKASEKVHMVALSGEWKFTSDTFSNPEIWDQEAPNQLVPKEWDGDAQYGTYQLMVILPDHYSEVGLRIRNIWSAHSLFVNGESLAEVGRIATNKREMIPHNPTYEIYLKPKTKELLLTIHVSNFYNARGGMVFPIDLGEAQSIKKDVDSDFSLEWAAVLLLSIFSIFHITIYLLRRKDIAYLYSGLYFFSVAIVAMTRSERVLLKKFPELSFDFYFRFQDSVTMFSPILLFLFIAHTIPYAINKKLMRIWVAPIVIYSLLILCLPARSLSFLQYPFFYYLNAILAVIILRIIVITFQKKQLLPKNEITIIIVMLLFLFVSTISGSIDQLFFSGRNIFSRVGLIGFIISMNVFLGIRLINRTEDAEKLMKRLEKANVAKDAFLEVTMQELKNPLYHAINLTKAVQRETLQENNGTRLQMIEQLLERFIYLVRDLQDFTRIRFQDYSIDIQSTNVSMIIQHIEQLMAFSFSRKRIDFDMKIPESLYVLADEKRLTQVFYRIIGEASTYASNGSIEVSVQQVEQEVYIHFKTKSGYLLTFPEHPQAMSLLLSKELIEGMKGQLLIENIETGLLYTVILPFSEYKELLDLTIPMVHEAKSKIAATIHYPTGAQSILIVEDDPVQAEVLASMLNSSYSVIITYTAQDALKLVRENSDISLVIIDSLMPGMDGIELTKHIRQTTSLLDLPVLITTSVDYPSDIEAIFSSGANDYLIKPVTRETLLARIRAVEQTKKSLAKAVENEMAFLQSQIKPHFLYNALSNIISFCYTDGERAAHLLSMLSSYLRYIFESGKEGHDSSIQQEIEIIEAYVEIEKARFGDRLTFSCHIEPSINPYVIKIPSLLIQPIIENSIRHGLFEKEGNGHVQLTIKQNQKNLVIEVVDDGIGMTPEKVEQLIEGSISYRGIGFNNVLRRVKDISKGDVVIQSEFGKGTTVIVFIPVKEQ